MYRCVNHYEVCQELPPQRVRASNSPSMPVRKAIVQGERGQLKSVIANIVSNAIKFSRPGGVVTITQWMRTTTWFVHLPDRGIIRLDQKNCSPGSFAPATPRES